MPANDEAIAAFLRERQGYVNRGLDARVALVDRELKALGYRAKAKSEQETKAEPETVEVAVEGPAESADRRRGPRT